MPFTFARYLDPMIQAPTIQSTIVASLLSLPLLDPSRDASGGEVLRVMRDWNWMTWKCQARDLVFIRRFKLKPDGKNPVGKLWIGIELNMQAYRITCEGLTGQALIAFQKQLTTQGLSVKHVEFGPNQCCRVRSIVKSAWAARAPSRLARVEENDVPPPRPMGNELYWNDSALVLDTSVDSQEELVEQQQEAVQPFNYV